MFLAGTALFLCVVSSAQTRKPKGVEIADNKARRPNPSARLEHPIVSAVQNTSSAFVFSTVKQWSGNQDAYRALVSMLQRKPEDSEDWRTAIDALAVIAAGNRDLGLGAVPQLRLYATNLLRFNSDIPSGDGTTLDYASFISKTEVPHALGLLGRLTSFSDVSSEAVKVLEQNANPHYWAQAEWTSTPHYETGRDRSLDLVSLSIRALGEICTQESRTALARVTEYLNRAAPYQKHPEASSTLPVVLREALDQIPAKCAPVQ